MAEESQTPQNLNSDLLNQGTTNMNDFKPFGGQKNTASGSQSFVGGGGTNLATSTGTVVAGGLGNFALGFGSSTVGGNGNQSNGD